MLSIILVVCSFGFSLIGLKNPVHLHSLHTEAYLIISVLSTKLFHGFHSFLLFLEKYADVLTWHSRRPLIIELLLIPPSSLIPFYVSVLHICDPAHHTYFSLLAFSCFWVFVHILLPAQNTLSYLLILYSVTFLFSGKSCLFFSYQFKLTSFRKAVMSFLWCGLLNGSFKNVISFQNVLLCAEENEK